MYNLHCHSLLSDGALLASEVAARYMAAGYKVIAITDHVDYSNIESVVKSMLKFTSTWPKNSPIKVLSGIELTHLPLSQFKPLVKYARKSGIQVIVGHGETPVEPVIEGTNLAAIEAGVDILAHPGLISDEDVMLAIKKNVFLEITARAGHNQTNRHVAKQALKFGAKLILDTDGHTPNDIISPEELKKVGLDAGLTTEAIDKMYLQVGDFLRRRKK
jgi:putative hydrolase